jgi:hypothetical protein
MITTAIHNVCLGLELRVLAALVYVYHGAETVRVVLNNLKVVSSNG